MNATAPTVTDAWSVKGYGRAEDLSLGSLPIARLGLGEMLVEMEAAALNPLDLKLIAGNMRAVMPTSFPYVPGNDVCGHVVAVADGITDYSIGERVVGLTPHNGGMARFAIFAHGPTTAHAPDTGSAVELAALPEAGMTAMAVMRTAQLKSGDRMLVIGATGGIGLFLCQLASRIGVHVIATASAGDVQLVSGNGAAETIDHTSGDTVDQLKPRYPNGVDVVVDLINQNEKLVPTARGVQVGGKLISTLMGPEPGQFPDHGDMQYVRLSPTVGDLQQLVSEVGDRSLRSNVGARFAFAEAPEAYVSRRDGHVQGKIVVEA